MTDDAPERRRPDWWALEPAVTRRKALGMEIGKRSVVTNHYLVEVTGEVTHLPGEAADELGILVEHKLNEIADDYELIETESERIDTIHEDTLAGRRLMERD